MWLGGRFKRLQAALSVVAGLLCVAALIGCTSPLGVEPTAPASAAAPPPGTNISSDSTEVGQDGSSQEQPAAKDDTQVFIDIMKTVGEAFTNLDAPIIDGARYCAELDTVFAGDPDLAARVLVGNTPDQQHAISTLCSRYAKAQNLALRGFLDGAFIVSTAGSPDRAARRIRPGTYTAVSLDGQPLGSDCGWFRTANGKLVGAGSADGVQDRVTLTIKNGETLTVTGCGVWLPDSLK